MPAWRAIGAVAAFGFLHHLVLGAQPGLAEDEEKAKQLGGRRATMTVSDYVRRTTAPACPPWRGPRAGSETSRIVDRYTAGARINHWITATSLVLLALSGLALFHPEPLFPDRPVRRGQTTRAIHPWIGVVLFFASVGLFLRFWRPISGSARTAPGWPASRDVLAAQGREPAGARQIQCRPEDGVLVDVAADHRV